MLGGREFGFKFVTGQAALTLAFGHTAQLLYFRKDQRPPVVWKPVESLNLLRDQALFFGRQIRELLILLDPPLALLWRETVEALQTLPDLGLLGGRKFLKSALALLGSHLHKAFRHGCARIAELRITFRSGRGARRGGWTGWLGWRIRRHCGWRNHQ